MNNETLCAIARQLLKQQQASNSSIVEGLLPTCSPDIDLFYQTSAQELRPTLYAPGLVFLFSGEKSVQLGQNYYVYNPSKALLLTGVYPVYCNIRASEQEPVIGIQIRFERKQVAQLLHHLTVHSDSTSEQMAAAHSHSGFLSVQVTPAIQTALYGLLNALGNPVTCDLFMPTHIQTLVYAALEQADVCAFIREWLEQDGSFAKFLQASEFLLRQLDQPVTLHDLASHMGMSIPTLQRRFKHYTADSPMQYLKKVRLSHAYARLTQTNCTVQSAAYAVGYESVSQFSREFKRYYGQNPQQVKQIWNECSRLITNAVIYYNTVLLSRVYEQKQTVGDQNALAQLHSISPVAWQHINMYGNFEFSPSTSKIDIDALVARYAEPEYWKQALIENENSSE